MRVFLNGQFVPEDQALVSIFDRSFLYGDGLYETIRVHAGKPFRWQQHVERLQRGAEILRLRLPYGPAEIRAFADQIRQLTEDDTYVGWLFRTGQIGEYEARTHPRRNLLQKALGGGNQFVDPQLGSVAVQNGDEFVILDVPQPFPEVGFAQQAEVCH